MVVVLSTGVVIAAVVCPGIKTPSFVHAKPTAVGEYTVAFPSQTVAHDTFETTVESMPGPVESLMIAVVS